ncbi:MAG: carbohydrate-binding protein [Proteobacteria bacterium]|nr:carbohydrate-binding protein [Pseudomonadota bacterium]
MTAGAAAAAARVAGIGEGLPALAYVVPAVAPVEAPIRAEIFGPARFEQHGDSLAAVHRLQPQAQGSTASSAGNAERANGARAEPFFPRLQDNVAVLRRAGALLERRAREGAHLGPAGHWLLDNAPLIAEQSQAIRGALSRSFYRRLPRLRDAPLAGLPRIYGLAWAYVAHSDSHLDEALLGAYLGAYQRRQALTLAELWALPTTLRVVLVENLRRLAERVVATQAARDAAHQWFDTPEAARSIDALDALHAELNRRGVAEAFLLQLEQRQDELSVERERDLAAWLTLRLPHAAEAEARQQAQAIEDQQSVRNAITSLRRIDRIDWAELFQRDCQALQRLAECPVYAAESDGTQNRTLLAVQRLARESGQSEAEVARLLRDLCRRALDAEDPRGAPGWWWDGDGEAVLRQGLGLRPRRWPRQGSAALRRWATLLMLPGLLLASAGGTAWLLHHAAPPALPGWMLALTALLLMAPASEAVVAMVNRLISESLRPQRLPRLALADGIPEAQRTLVVIPALLGSAEAIAALAAQLEQHHLANPEGPVQFALLSDWPDAEAASAPADEAQLALARQAIDGLNQRHPAAAGQPLRFLLLHRPRTWCETQQRFIGWERKRGKLEQLVRLLAAENADEGDAGDAGDAGGAGDAVDAGAAGAAGGGGATPSPFIDLGALSRPAAGVRHVVTLDSDTDMPPGRLHALVAVAAHPLNRPQLDAAQRRVVAGHGILQPRLQTPLPAGETQTGFHWLFAGRTGVDPYSAASSEVYQDLFGEGSFSGKGLIDVAAARRVLVGRLPEQQVLSHDLLEGSYARCAVVSDIVFVEDAPLHADVAASRLHRWTRGDWQLLPFLRRAGRDGLPMIDRWKLVDNLRRSLVAPLAALLLLWVLWSGALPIGWTLAVVAAAYGAGPLLGALAALAPSRDDIALAPFFRAGGADLARALLTPVWHVALLLDRALLDGDAIVRALLRHFVTRRELLQWTTAAAAQAAARPDLRSIAAQHARTPAAAAGLLLLSGLLALAGAPVDWLPLLALLALWAAAPLWVWLASRPHARPRRERLDEAERETLHELARDTWRLYERYVGAEDHHLPPDSVQMQPHTMVAHRTSPTNIGMYLLAVACAQRLGFIGCADMAERVAATLDTLERLPRHRGHFYNWIDTRTLALLPPAYVSTVDSGNASAALLVLAQACERLAERGCRGAAQDHAVQQALEQSARRLRPLLPVLAAAPTLGALSLLATQAPPWPPADAERPALAQRLQAARRELDDLNLGGHGLNAADETGPLWLLHDHLATLESALRDTAEGAAAASTERLRALAQRARRLALQPDYRCLYDRRRRLLHIGLRADSGQLDDSHYDLLASEARLTSLVAIAKGDLPAEHWAALGRPFFARGSHAGLKSWAGSMFEYLMPSLLLDEPAGSVLAEATRSAVRLQQQEGAAHGTPWGISESAIAVQDETFAYQYGPQGVARLALRRTPADERVLAPYATALAALVDPDAALANLQALQGLGARRSLGFIESLDYTPQRQSGQAPGPVLVHTFMAHHQAMSLLAFTDLLTQEEAGPRAVLPDRDRGPRQWASVEPYLRAVATLLHERPPRELPRLAEPPAVPPGRADRGGARQQWSLETTPLADALPATLLLGNGAQAAWLRSDGGGLSRWQGVALTRWRDDLLRDAYGSWLYVEREVGRRFDGDSDSDGDGDGDGDEQADDAGARPPPRRHSLTAHPAPDPAARYRTRLHPDRAVFDADWPGELLARSTVWISPEDDCELRQVELQHRGDAPLALVISFAAEVTLAAPAADLAHPAFSNLFVRAHWDAEDRALYLHRQPRLPDEAPMLAAFFVAGGGVAGGVAGGLASGLVGTADGGEPPLQACVDRARWLGRHGSSAWPRGDGGAQALPQADAVAGLPGQPLDTGLDPVAVLRVRLTLAPGAKTSLVFACAAARDADALAARIDRYRHPAQVQRASAMAHTMSAIRLRELAVDAANWHALQRLQTLLAWSAPREPALAQRRDGDACERALLWRLGLSGERPLLLVHVADDSGLPLLQLLKSASRGWSAAGLGVDLVFVNGEPASYLMPVQRQLQQLRERHLAQQDERWPEPQRCKLHLLRDDDLQLGERQTLLALARVRLAADGRSLAQQLDRVLDELQRDAERLAALPRLVVDDPLLPPQLLPAPQGAFDAADGAFGFAIEPDRRPQRPWVNVLANAGFGCQVSEIGAGMSWAWNSRQHQITPWSNDPLRDPAGEWLLLHDVDRGRVWPLGPAAAAQVTHAPGWTRIRQAIAGLQIELTWCVDADDAVKQLRIEIDDLGREPRRLRLVAVAEWQLGDSRAAAASVATRAERLVTGPQGVGLPAAAAQTVLLATQLDPGPGLGTPATAFLAWRRERAPRAADEPDDDCDDQDDNRGDDRGDDGDWTCDRRELFDARGRRVLPARLGRRAGLGLDPCGAIACTLPLAAGARGRATLLLGHAPTPAAARRLALSALATDPAQRLQAQRAQWDWTQAADSVQVQSPDPRFDALVNHWLPYQTLACRLWARAGFYQAGGAFGFRDQLQDAMGLVWHAPERLAAQIRLHATRQFAAGDVQHWWHPPAGAGVRTHVSDDLLWLPYALALHVERGGDAALLDEPLPFLAGAEVPADREDVYETPTVSAERASLYEHGARAIDHSLRTGAHGLPLIGSGDWNDGMNRVGFQGRGESVWLAWFLCDVVRAYLPLAAARGDADRVERWSAARRAWQRALDADGWDGRWYRRAFFDDGTPLGSDAGDECRIDLIAQAWAVLSGAGDAERAQQAMHSVREQLLDVRQALLPLLAPPLQHARPSAGYIQAYPGGVRENGGQYNHAAVWGLMAFAAQGDADAAWQVWQAVSPAHRWRDAVQGERYALEPFVLAGDIHTRPPHACRGGWSWYSGSAGWLLRAAVESLAGLTRAGDTVRLRPCLPPHWRELTLTLRHRGRTLTLRLVTKGGAGGEGADADHALAVGAPLDLRALRDGEVRVVTLPLPPP